MPRPFAFVVAVLMVVEGTVMSWQGVSWPVPYAPLAVVVIGLLFPRIAGFWRTAIIAIACLYAAVFVFPGSVWALFGSCGGVMGSTCSDAEFLSGVAAYFLAAVVNIVAAVLVARTGRKASTADPADDGPPTTN